MHSDLPSGTVTFLFTDVEGSTKLLDELGSEGYAEALAAQRRIVRAACAAQGGVEVDTQGDAFFFAFPTAPGALAAAKALTEGLSSGPIRVRVGVHTGTPLLAEEGYVGDDVHRAARIAASGHGGQVLVSSSTATLVELQLRDLGAHRFKDLTAAERVYQLSGVDFPPLKTLHQTNLPVPATPFLGRENELADVLDLLSREDVRLLTLTGPGGTGKTRLAAQAAGALADRYPDGVWWVPLATLRDPELVLESAAQVVGARENLAAQMTDKRLLLLFDNFEQVVEAAWGLAHLLSECPHVELLVTSREPLHLSAEHEYPVPPFVYGDALDFFVSRARAVEPDFEPDEAVPDICRRLDSLPLALELAAARVKALSSAQILERLEQRMSLFTGGSRDAPERQRTLRAAIEWSYDLLSPEEQKLFAYLSVFSGGCTLEVAAEVAGAELDTLQSLVEKSLVRFREGRHWMLETIREYSAERLHMSGDAQALRRRHAEHFLAFAEDVAPETIGADERQLLDLLDAELSNFRIALEHFEAADDARSELRLAARLRRYWLVRGHLSEGRRALARALAVAPAEMVDERLRALWGAAQLARLQGDYDDARSLAAQALEVARSIDNGVMAAHALHTLALIAVDEGHLEFASRLLEEATTEFRRGEETHSLAVATSVRGYIALTRGEYAEAVVVFEETLALGHQLGSDEVVVVALLNLGVALHALGRIDDASSAFLESLRLSVKLRSRDWISYAQEGLAAVCVAKGEMDQGLQLAASAEVMRRELGTSLDPAEQRVHEVTLQALEDHFPDDVVAATFDGARELTLEEVLALLVEVTPTATGEAPADGADPRNWR